MYGLSHLTPFRQAVLRKLDDGPKEDSVGIELQELTGREMRAADYLVDRGLAEFSIGWKLSCWYRLTDAGRDVLAQL